MAGAERVLHPDGTTSPVADVALDDLMGPPKPGVGRRVENHDPRPLSPAAQDYLARDPRHLAKHLPATADEPSSTVPADAHRGVPYALLDADGLSSDGRTWESRHPVATADEAAPAVRARSPRDAGRCVENVVDVGGATRLRRLTVRECARLQDFPDNFVLRGAKTHQYRQVGNAAPPGLIEPVARAIREALAKVRPCPHDHHV